MALENAQVLENLRSQLNEVTTQINTLADTRLKLLGAVDVLEQIEDSKKVDNPPEPVEEVVEPSPLEEVLEG
jgi:hypothetical protein